MFLKVVLRKGGVQASLKEAEGIFTPKERDSKTINQFRTISLLNVERENIHRHPSKKTDIFPDRQFVY